MIDILLVERKEKIYRKDFLLRRVFRIGRKQPKQCGVKLWATYIYIYIYIYINHTMMSMESSTIKLKIPVHTLSR